MHPISTVKESGHPPHETVPVQTAPSNVIVPLHPFQSVQVPVLEKVKNKVSGISDAQQDVGIPV
jgi:hypothetical protein